MNHKEALTIRHSLGSIVGFSAWIRSFLASTNPLLPGTVAAAVSLGMWQLGVWQPLERLGYNALFRLRPDPGWDRRIAVIAIEETSLQEYGQFPWPRDRYVQLLQALKTSPPAAIGFDILFIDPSSKDAELASAIAANGKVVLARGGEGEEPLLVLGDAAAGVGQIVHEPDDDGISREATVFLNWTEDVNDTGGTSIEKSKIPALGLAVLQVSETKDFQRLSSKKVWLNWPGRLESDPTSGIIDAIPTYPFVDVVEGKFPQDAFAGKLVLVGLVATGFDELVSPLQGIAGVYLHAALIDNLLNNRLLQRLPNAMAMLLLVAIGVMTSWIQFDRGLKGRLAIALLLPLGWFAIAFAAFSLGNWWLPVAAPIGTMILAGTGVQLREQYEKQQLMQLFSKHVAPEMANMIWQRKAEIFENGDLPAQEVTATVLFMDIRGFTSISERMAPRDLLVWLNEYLDQMAECIMDKGGVIDKYIGDAIMAVFGIPFPHTEPEEIKQDALNAIAACLAMHQRLKPLNQRLKAQNKPQIGIGIGMHTGSAIAGPVGGKRRANYSVLGDTVNVAARLEPMNKQFTENNPYNLLVTSDTFEYVRDRYLGQQVGEIQLRGKATPTIIYSILGEQPEAHNR